MDKISKEQILKIERRIRREIAKENGYYDGRNVPKVILDKKKEQNKQYCRGKINND